MFIKSNALSLKLTNKMKQSQTNLQKTIEKLSTGQRINQAADDASGLAISQKLLALKRGSHQAIQNVQNAGSLVQVADGAMQEMTNILQRIRELSIRAMNGTYTEVEAGNSNSTADTLIIQNEVDKLKKNLNDIVKNTEFNTKKLLTNTAHGEYIYEQRSASTNIQLKQTSQIHAVDLDYNNVGYNKIGPESKTINHTYTNTPSISSVSTSTESYNGSTIMDTKPRFSTDGQSILFSSSRVGGEYVIPVDASIDPVVNTDVTPVSQKVKTDDGLMRLTSIGSTLTLEKRTSSTSGYWVDVQSFNYNHNDGNAGYSFSPNIDADGNTSFVYADNKGNIQKVEVNVNNQTVTNGPVGVIPSTDELNIPAANQTITLPTSPDLYRMDDPNASFQIEKWNDDGARKLTYWDGNNTPPSGGYYTVNGNTVTFFGDAIIGNETVDDAQDFYKFSYVSDTFQDNVYSTSIPSGAEVYNMHGETGPRSLNISIGGSVITKAQLLASRPTDVEGTTGVYVDGANGKIEFYGDLRPAYNQTVTIEYMADADGRNQIQTFDILSNIDTYNLTDPDLSSNRSLRVYVDGTEIKYEGTNGYTYENGRICLHGDARTDISANPSVQIEYVSDRSYSNTSKDVYGIPLNSDSPQIYNLGSTTSPNSIRVYRNGTEEIAYLNVEGFQYNQGTNTIELYGESRPGINDTYTIQMVASTGDVSQTDDKVEVPLYLSPETYGTPNPTTFRVLVDGNEIDYDSTKANGYYYNSGTNRIEIYGAARPDADNTSDPDVEVYYAYESPYEAVGNDSYDFGLAPNTLDYGVDSQTEPRSIRVYQNGAEVPYDVDNGFTYDAELNRVSLHGNYRPNKNNNTGDYKVYSITADDLTKSVPQGSYIYKVEMNGQEIQEAQDAAGDGYSYNGSQVEIIGNVRPDVTSSTNGVTLNVHYFDPGSLEIGLNEDMPNDYFHNYCDHETGGGFMDAEIDPNSLNVSLNGNTLNSNQYVLQGNKVVLKQDKITLNTGGNTLSVDYRARQATGFEPNEFIFQVGANSGQNMKLEIASFDNMLQDTSIICVRTHEDASKGLEVIDNALEFVLDELGDVGAVQNSLDHISSNLSNLEENTTASLSRIQDADMAKQSMNLVKEQILAQVQQAMFAHVNQSSEQVLQLLK